MYFLSMIKLYWMFLLSPEDGEQDKVAGEARKNAFIKTQYKACFEGDFRSHVG